VIPDGTGKIQQIPPNRNASPPPPRPELIALLDAVKDHPDDDTPRLVLADWLDEQDNPLDAERAAFIREHVAVSRAGSFKQAAEVRAGRDERARRWLGPVISLGHANFERGLPLMHIAGPRLLKPDAPTLLASEEFALVQFVALVEAGGPRMEKMAAIPEFRHVPGLSVDPLASLGVHYATKFFGSPYLTGLRQISFRGVDPGAAGMAAFASNPAFARLRKLSLVHNKLVDKAVIALASGVHLLKLEVLDLSDNLIGDVGADALAVSPTLTNLRELNLRDNPRLTDRGKHVLRDRFSDRVKLDSTLVS
jgi:uncharacterized protein (TIGR02996 family)